MMVSSRNGLNELEQFATVCNQRRARLAGEKCVHRIFPSLKYLYGTGSRKGRDEKCMAHGVQ